MHKFFFAVLAAAACASAQQKSDLPVRVNYMNVCAPSDADRQEMSAALARIPANARFSPEFEVARGRTTAPDAPLANWVRVRREFATGSALTNVQYSISSDSKGYVETMVFRWRDPKDVLQAAIEDTAPVTSSPAAVMAADTPARRIRIERFGKGSLALSRCPGTDQSAFEAIFSSASTLLRKYRAALEVGRIVPRELALLMSEPARSSPAGEAKSRKQGARTD